MKEPDAAEPFHQETLITLSLALTDKFSDSGLNSSFGDAREVVQKLDSNYCKSCYTGIIYKRRAKYHLKKGALGSGPVAYEWFAKAMTEFEKALVIIVSLLLLTIGLIVLPIVGFIFAISLLVLGIGMVAAPESKTCQLIMGSFRGKLCLDLQENLTRQQNSRFGCANLFSVTVRILAQSEDKSLNLFRRFLRGCSGSV